MMTREQRHEHPGMNISNKGCQERYRIVLIGSLEVNSSVLIVSFFVVILSRVFFFGLRVCSNCFRNLTQVSYNKIPNLFECTEEDWPSEVV